jgi:hypothetical protein
VGDASFVGIDVDDGLAAWVGLLAGLVADVVVVGEAACAVASPLGEAAGEAPAACAVAVRARSMLAVAVATVLGLVGMAGAQAKPNILYKLI